MSPVTLIETAMPKNYRLALDVGTTSIGWCALELNALGDAVGILRMGVRVFPDGRDEQSGGSLAADRRLARSARRRRDRFRQRQRRLMAGLIRLGLMPTEAERRRALAALDPYALRRDAVSGPLTAHELGRALFHLNQRRGFQSSRRAPGDKKEKGKIDAGVAQLRALIAESGAPTLGAWLAARRAARHPTPGADRPPPETTTVRARLSGTGAKAFYPFYPSRALVREEFEHIRAVQAPHHPSLTAADWDDLCRSIFAQRPLKPVSPGRCTFFPAEERLAWAMPAAQRFRIAQEVANLRVIDRNFRKHPLTAEQRALLRDRLASKAELSFKTIAALLRLPADAALNLEDARRDHLQGDETTALLAHKKRMGKLWTALPADQQAEIVERLLTAEQDADITPWLRERFGLTAEQADAVCRTDLPDGHCRLGATAIGRLLPVMESDGLDYTQAAKKIGLHHSDLRRQDGDALSRLPFYAEVPEMERHLLFGSGRVAEKDPFRRIGRIANPTVHIGLNQIRAVVNELIAEYGRPHDIIVELARDLNQSAEDRRRHQIEQVRNQRANEQRRQTLARLGQAITPDNMIRLRLWEEQPLDGVAHRCVYTGQTISLEMLFSAAVEVDHILPYSRTLDDSVANRLVCLRAANRIKRDLSPWEAFAEDRRPDYDWGGIASRAWRLPENKRWRFDKDAMQRFDDAGRFEARMLNDTRYLSRLVRQYLGCLYDLRREGDRVRAVPGTLVGLLRRKWGLNDLISVDGEKNRNDHRHHAIDAAIIAIINQRTVQMVQTAARQADIQDLDRLIATLPLQHNWLRDQMEQHLARIVVSVKPDHGISGRLHEDTSYGIIPQVQNIPAGAFPPGHTLVHRKPFDSLTASEVARIRDPDLRDAVADHLARAALDGLDHAQALADFPKRRDHSWPDIRHVRLTKVEAGFEIIRDRQTGAPYRAVIPDGNLCVDVVRLADGRWEGRAITPMRAARLARENGAPGAPPHLPAPGPDVVMRLYKGDLIRMSLGDKQEVMRVHGLDIVNQRLRLAPHREGGKLQTRHEDKEDPFRWTFAAFNVLRRQGARKVTVTPAGRLRDPGPPRDTGDGE